MVDPRAPDLITHKLWLAAGEGGAYPPASLIGKSHTRAAPSAP
jgi:hypothetical protein